MATPTPRPPADVEALLALLQRDPGRPRITWYGSGGERVELSGAVLANWVSKTTNLLVDEVDAAPLVRVRLDLPAHWRTLVWALAVWRCGACVVLDAQDADVVVTDRPAQAPAGSLVVAVALPALARGFGPDLPGDAVDGAAVLSQPDVVVWAPALVPDAPALVADGTTVAHDRLLTTGPAEPDGRRVAIAGDDLSTVVRTALTTWASDGSVVLVEPGVAAELRSDPARRARVLGPENVTDDRV
ncbi:TIGR03089 family protein [Cellulomonas xiejunii]|uniref:TIGR03089 family protein n=1 Tax=Cellulomonas xiejunii TaxID=2968083 RepID=UPI001D0EA48F|nr:TIGR03089 family protein [Cellulomonas xiejunii]MCC2312942.1 TIGR03089 family protein [Cellulomonas xiejunii]